MLVSPHSKAECRRRLIPCLAGRLQFRWVTWASAWPTRRLVGRVDQDIFRAVIARPATPKALRRLPRVVLALSLFQSGLQVLTARLANGSHGTVLLGEINHPTAEYVLAIGVVCSAAAILMADLSFHLVNPPAVVLFHYANAIRWRSRRRPTHPSSLAAFLPPWIKIRAFDRWCPGQTARIASTNGTGPAGSLVTTRRDRIERRPRRCRQAGAKSRIKRAVRRKGHMRRAAALATLAIVASLGHCGLRPKPHRFPYQFRPGGRWLLHPDGVDGERARLLHSHPASRRASACGRGEPLQYPRFGRAVRPGERHVQPDWTDDCSPFRSHRHSATRRPRAHRRRQQRRRARSRYQDVRRRPSCMTRRRARSAQRDRCRPAETATRPRCCQTAAS